MSEVVETARISDYLISELGSDTFEVYYREYIYFIYLMPEIVLITAIFDLLSSSVREVKGRLGDFDDNKYKSEVYLISLIFAYFSLKLFGPFTTTDFYFDMSVIVDIYSFYAKMLIVLTTFFIVYISSYYLNFIRCNEFFVLIFLALFFMLLLVSAYNFITMFIGIVGFSLNLYVLILFNTAERNAKEAGIKYFYLSAFSSGLILYGILLIYFFFNTVNFLAIKLQLHQLIVSNELNQYSSILFILVIFLLIGFLFKLSAFPCHLWTPEVYEGSPALIMAFFILPVKITILTFLIRLLSHVFNLLINL